MKTSRLLLATAALGLLTFTASAQSWVTNGLVAYYPFNGNNNDVAGQNPLIFSNIIFGTDRLGNSNSCITFDGNITRWVRSQNVVAANIMDNFTMTIWAKPAGFLDTNLWINGTGGSTLLFATHGSWVYGAGHAGVGILLGTNGITIIEHADNYGRCPVTIMMSLTAWTQIGVVYSNGVPLLYLNGKLVGSGTTNPSYHFHPSSGFSVAGVYGGLGLAAWFNNNTSQWDMNYPYKGTMDDFRIYSRALASNEVSALYSLESAPIISIQKAIYLTSSNLWAGTNYQVQASTDLLNWTNQGSVFTATNSSWRSTNYWDVANWNQLFFRLQQQ
jgi:Concanavalin A-like lectin/glucanases superfamily